MKLLIGVCLMARKSVKGYAEKNYYDNTKFNGVKATYDPLNEGYFRHLVNFDISDAGQSLTPREGFLTSMPKNLSFSDKTIYFNDPRTDRYVFIDFAQHPYAYAGTLTPGNDLYLNDFTELSHDITDLQNVDISSIEPVSSRVAIPAVDEYGIQRNLIKVNFTENGMTESKILEIVLNENELVYTFANTDDVVSIDPSKRNLASSKNIIPNPMWDIYNESNPAPDGHYDYINPIYIQQDGKYLINTTNKRTGLTFKPSFFIKDFDSDDNYTWGYTYDIVSTNPDADYFSYNVYRAPIFDMDHKVLVEPYMFATKYSEYIEEKIRAVDDPELTLTDPKWEKVYKDAAWDIALPKYLSLSEFDDTVIVFCLPAPDYNKVCVNGYTNTRIIRTQDDEGNITNPDHVLLKILVSSATNANAVFDLSDLTSDASTVTRNVTQLPYIKNVGTLKEFKNALSLSGSRYVIKRFRDIKDDYVDTCNLFSTQTALNSRVFTFNPNELLDLDTMYERLIELDPTQIIFKEFYTSQYYSVTAASSDNPNWDSIQIIYNRCSDPLKHLFPITSDFIFCTDIYTTGDIETYDLTDDGVLENNDKDIVTKLFYSNLVNGSISDLSPYPVILPNTPIGSSSIKQYLNIQKLNGVDAKDVKGAEGVSPFNNNFEWVFNENNYLDLKNKLFFQEGIHIKFYLVPVIKEEIVSSEEFIGTYDIYDRERLISATSLFTSRQIIWSQEPPTYYVETITKEPTDIHQSKNMIVFHEPLGDRLVIWEGNTVYMSSNIKYYYFTEMYTYNEKVIKVIQYKDTLLVFTAQNLYSIFPYESTVPVQDGVDDEGNPKYVNQTTIVYNTLPVLYNLMVDEKYADAIQVFNQMVLFYSADGQMFMIKPTATIDSNTRFSIQYFNKDVNDILANYDTYINERLYRYNITEQVNKDDITIKVKVSLTHIHIFYCVPGVITYILIYDIINNRYYCYDTISFSYVDSFDYDYIFTLFQNRLYVTQVHSCKCIMDSHHDAAIYYNFKFEPINAELDTGNLNLNNHLKKRFRALHTLYKNIDATSVKLGLESYIDDVPTYVAYSHTMEVQNIEDRSCLVYTTSDEVVDLLEDNTALFDFSAYTSNKLLEYKTGLLGSGKNIRLCISIKSNGLYKIRGYGIIYKEHRV